MELCTLENGVKQGGEKEKEFKNGLIIQSTLVSGKMTKQMGMENLYMQMEICTKVSG
jgi:hypothetical protein